MPASTHPVSTRGEEDTELLGSSADDEEPGSRVAIDITHFLFVVWKWTVILE